MVVGSEIREEFNVIRKKLDELRGYL